MSRLLAVLLIVLSDVGMFYCGMQFERELHRPIHVGSITVEMPVHEHKDTGIFPEGQEVCTAFTNICWYRI